MQSSYNMASNIGSAEPGIIKFRLSDFVRFRLLRYFVPSE